MSEDDYHTLTKAQAALSMLTTLLYEAESCRHGLDAVEMAALVSFPAEGLRQMMDNVEFVQRQTV